MKINPDDLIVRFDSKSKKIQLLTPNNLLENDSLGCLFSIKVQSKIPASEISLEIGDAISTFLHMKYPSYFLIESTEHSKSENEENELKGSFDEARLLIDRLSDQSSVFDVDAITAMLKNASKNGDQIAGHYLTNIWPELKLIFLKRISRTPE